MYIHVCSLHCTYHVHTIMMYIHVYDFSLLYIPCIYMYIHFVICIYMSQQCTYNSIVSSMYVHGSDMYVHVYTFTYKYCIIQTCTYKVQTRIYMFMQENVPCTDGYINFMNCTDIDEPCTYIVQLCTYTDISFLLQLFAAAARREPCWLAC